MIALHLRDSTTHLITSSQNAGPGTHASFGGSPFRSPCSPRFRPLLLISATSIGSGVIHLLCSNNKYKEVHCQHVLCIFTKTLLIFIKFLATGTDPVAKARYNDRPLFFGIFQCVEHAGCDRSGHIRAEAAALHPYDKGVRRIRIIHEAHEPRV